MLRMSCAWFISMFYDLHIHSALSPCADDEMTPHNIAGMAMLKGLNLLAVSDHNSLKQQAMMAQAAVAYGLQYIYGVEVQTQEEVHVLAYFKTLTHAEAFQKWLDERLLPIFNDPNYFGRQLIFEQNDEIIAEEKHLLLQSVTANLNETMKAIHEHHGIAVLAHVLDRANSIMTQLGFIPQGLVFDGIEIKQASDRQKVCTLHPWLDNRLLWLIDSDAHQLIDISEADHQLDLNQLEDAWRKYL